MVLSPFRLVGLLRRADPRKVGGEGAGVIIAGYGGGWGCGLDCRVGCAYSQGRSLAGRPYGYRIG